MEGGYNGGIAYPSLRTGLITSPGLFFYSLREEEDIIKSRELLDSGSGFGFSGQIRNSGTDVFNVCTLLDTDRINPYPRNNIV